MFPDLIDLDGVSTSLEPRPLGETDDATRAAMATATGGQPLVDYDGPTNPYIDYQFIDILHSLQRPRSEGYDEFFFIIVGQVKELLFRGLHFELFNARHQVDADDLDQAVVMLERCRVLVEQLASTWDLLGTISPDGFNQFRNQLATASGQLSFLYRHVEFVLGNKSRELAAAHDNVAHIWPAMEQALHTPSLYDAVLAALARAGHGIDASMLDRDWADPYRPHESVVQAWAAVYADPSPVNVWYRLGQTLIELDEAFSLYRWRHFTGVHKTIGFKPGTGGSAGVAWLKAVTEHRFFPELWSVRDHL